MVITRVCWAKLFWSFNDLAANKKADIKTRLF